MLWFPLAALVALHGGSSISRSGGETKLLLVRHYVTAYSNSRLTAAHARIPAWARRYNVNCSHCHTPVVPRLNEHGQLFKWAGYRMPEEIGENVEVGKVQNYLAAGLSLQYEWEKTKGEATRTSGFSLPAVTVFYAGPFGKNFGGFLELEHAQEGEIERVAQVSVLWGKEKRFGGFRVGQMHYLAEWGLAGLDRTVGINTPLPIEGPITGGVPFVLGEHQLGLEAFFVTGRNRLSAQILNGVNAEGMGSGIDADTKKDLLITDQYLLDSDGSGIQAFAYYGTIRGLDNSGTNADLGTHYSRLGITANKIFSNFEALGALIYGKDTDLPVGGTSPFDESVNKGVGWWLSAQYSFVKEKETRLTIFSRYEHVNPNTALTDAANWRFVMGGVVPINLPQYLRWAIEYHLDFPQGGAAKTNNFATELRLAF